MSAIIVPMDKVRAGRRLLAAAAPSEVAIRLAAAMKRANLTNAALCRLGGLQSSQVTQWLGGRNRPSLDALLPVLPFLDVPLQYLLIGDTAGLSYSDRDTLAEAEREARAARDAKTSGASGGAAPANTA